MPLSRHHTTAFFLGVTTTAALFLALGADDAPAPTPRYLLTKPWVTVPPNSGSAQHGTYRIDTQTGEMHEIVGSHSTRIN